jgi:16S rRNA (cytidine1402-2'-O)-methyltransferase
VLFLVGTPIGNLGDLSDRARRTLAAVDVVAAEDTRRTGRLLKSIGVAARMVSFFEGNEASRVPELMAALRDGHDVALVTDAGMPGISDPGYRLVAACVHGGIGVEVVPGPSAAVAALVVSGLPTDRFVFEGFLPRSGGARSQRLAALAAEQRTIVLFESARRLAGMLEELLAEFGDRRVVVARELTKLHQEVLRGSLSEVAADVRVRQRKGEVVVVVEGARGPAGAAPVEDAVALARELQAGGARPRQAARESAARTGVSSNEIYRRVIASTAHGPPARPGGS